jgi:GT2 family glycosyltransferase
MVSEKYSITFACYNALDYTKKCIDSLLKSNTPLKRVAIVDNCSTDGTQEYLQSLDLGAVIINKTNLGCGVAWNQGALAIQSEWTVVMNNDIIVSENWIDDLIKEAEKNNVKIISPAIIDGPLNYSFEEFSHVACDRYQNLKRLNHQHAVCMVIHESVWKEIGFFRATPTLLGYEDTLFFNAVKKNKIPTMTTGRVWIHHFGSITQTLMRQERGLKEKASLGKRDNYKELHQTWIERKLNKIRLNRRNEQSRIKELNEFGVTIHGIREQNGFKWL